MACYKPIPAYRTRDGLGVTFKHLEDATELLLPCGQCIGCRLEKSRQWAVRMMHEAQTHADNSFITLTYGPDFLPDDGSVNVQHFQDFMKRLRRKLEPLRIRFFHCGEYGEAFSRPHYHAIIFGFGFPDRVVWSETGEFPVYRSSFLDGVWNRGFCTVADVSFESCAYVARYVVKKINGDAALDHYWKLNEVTGELAVVSPEYCTMSRKPGIGAKWFEKYGDQVTKFDSVVSRGFEQKPPRFYESMMDVMELEVIKAEREHASIKRSADNTPERLRVREVVKKSQVSFLKRSFENAT